jgi:hypothetical protein
LIFQYRYSCQEGLWVVVWRAKIQKAAGWRKTEKKKIEIMENEATNNKERQRQGERSIKNILR